jgi:para-nitrobenzyl esterase
MTIRGVPYAAAPVGPLRFAAPEPHPGGTGVRDATRPGPTAPQPVRDGFGELDMSPYFGPGWRRGDDYLTVDIWPPRGRARPVPVMVFVHGGGFVAGSAGAPLYDGSAFARGGVLLIAVNYRLGIPGFLHLSDAPDNRGLLDVLAALRWVQDNAARFGGDPGNVTLFGQSAGATIVGGILADPRSTGLIRRAIMQSGSGTGAFHPTQAEIVTAAVATSLADASPAGLAGADLAGLADADLAGLTDADLVAILPHLSKLDLRLPGRPDPLGGISPFSLVLDRQPATSVNRDIDLMIGTNAEEGRLYATTDTSLQAIAARFHEQPEELIATYRKSRPGASVADLRVALLGDGLFGAGSRAMAAAHGNAYEYEFTWRSDTVGAAHVTELPFVFDTAGLPALHGPHGLLGTTAPPTDLAARMHAAWVRFATTGDPGWPPSQPGHRIVQQIGADWQLVHDPRPAESDAWL